MLATLKKPIPVIAGDGYQTGLKLIFSPILK
jgi:hypothetical protein